MQVAGASGVQPPEHRVVVPVMLGEGAELPAGGLERLVRESFRFLLEREPASSILSRFSLSDITNDFPEYPLTGRGQSPALTERVSIEWERNSLNTKLDTAVSHEQRPATRR